VDFWRHDSGVRRHQGKAPDGFHHQRPDAPSAHRRLGYPLLGCVPAEPDSVSPSSVRLASTEQRAKPPSDTGVMPQKILLYRFPTEKKARSYPHTWEKNHYNLDLADYYLRARYYDPATGRFRSRDPLTNVDVPNPAKFSMYGYAGNNPCVFSDPSGFYGQYCGYRNRGVPGLIDLGPPGNLTPIDTLDYCCQLHDECCTRLGILGGCSADLCSCAQAMRAGDCAIEHPGSGLIARARRANCELAATRIAALMCPLARAGF
jgi:RHS repeat-associated protein